MRIIFDLFHLYSKATRDDHQKTQIGDLNSLIRFDKESGSAWVKETNKYVKSFDYIAVIDENGKVNRFKH